MPHWLVSKCETTVISRLNANPIRDPSLKSIKGNLYSKAKNRKIIKETNKIFEAKLYEITWQYTWNYIVYLLLRKVICIWAKIVYSLFECCWIIVFIQNFVYESQEWLSVKQYLGILRFKGSLTVCQKWLEEYLYS